MKTFISTILLLIIVLVYLPLQVSDIPQFITHQGVLTSSNGTSVEDGTYEFILRIYNVETERIGDTWVGQMVLTESITMVNCGRLGTTKDGVVARSNVTGGYAV